MMFAGGGVGLSDRRPQSADNGLYAAGKAHSSKLAESDLYHTPGNGRCLTPPKRQEARSPLLGGNLLSGRQGMSTLMNKNQQGPQPAALRERQQMLQTLPGGASNAHQPARLGGGSMGPIYRGF